MKNLSKANVDMSNNYSSNRLIGVVVEDGIIKTEDRKEYHFIPEGYKRIKVDDIVSFSVENSSSEIKIAKSLIAKKRPKITDKDEHSLPSNRLLGEVTDTGLIKGRNGREYNFVHPGYSFVKIGDTVSFLTDELRSTPMAKSLIVEKSSKKFI